MKTLDFLKTLNENSEKELLFEYSPNNFVKSNYHITEIKNIHIDSVDCGGSSNSWDETVVQLWVNALEPNKTRAMSTVKAIAIFDKVANIKPLKLDTEIKIEYGNKNFRTAQLVAHLLKFLLHALHLFTFRI